MRPCVTCKFPLQEVACTLAGVILVDMSSHSHYWRSHIYSSHSSVLQHRYANQIREGGSKFEHLKSLRQVHSGHSIWFSDHEVSLYLQAQNCSRGFGPGAVAGEL